MTDLRKAAEEMLYAAGMVREAADCGHDCASTQDPDECLSCRVETMDEKMKALRTELDAPHVVAPCGHDARSLKYIKAERTIRCAECEAELDAPGVDVAGWLIRQANYRIANGAMTKEQYAGAIMLSEDWQRHFGREDGGAYRSFPTEEELLEANRATAVTELERWATHYEESAHEHRQADEFRSAQDDSERGDVCRKAANLLRTLGGSAGRAAPGGGE